MRRPLARRGRRQAPDSGRWLADNDVRIDHAVVSPAERARATWELVRAELAEAGIEPETIIDDDVYTFGAGRLLRVVRAFPERWQTVALVGHNPAMEELLQTLTGCGLGMPTSAVAVIDLPGEWQRVGDSPAYLVAHGRPPVESLTAPAGISAG